MNNESTIQWSIIDDLYIQDVVWSKRSKYVEQHYDGEKVNDLYPICYQTLDLT